jgi:hypothetical protein
MSTPSPDLAQAHKCANRCSAALFNLAGVFRTPFEQFVASDAEVLHRLAGIAREQVAELLKIYQTWAPNYVSDWFVAVRDSTITFCGIEAPSYHHAVFRLTQEALTRLFHTTNTEWWEFDDDLRLVGTFDPNRITAEAFKKCAEAFPAWDPDELDRVEDRLHWEYVHASRLASAETHAAPAADGVEVGQDERPPAGATTTPIVFVSSTIEDLEKHRGKARDAINQVGFVPRMKEYFAARGDQGPLAVCLEKVSGSATEPPADVVVLIVAHRYGWVPEDQPGSDRKSITWLECEKARENGKEVLAFVVEKDCDWPGELREENRIAEETARGTGTPELLREVQSNVDWLGRFKTWIDSLGIRATFTTPESLHGAVLAALHDWQKRHLNDVA